MSHSVVRLDNVELSPLYSVKHKAASTDTSYANIDNARVVLLNSKIDREVMLGVTPAVDSPKSQVALVAAPELMADERLKNLKDFENVAGKAFRCYGFVDGMEFSVTTDALTGTAAVGNVVELQANTKLKVAATLTSGSTQIGVVDKLETVGTLNYVVIRVC